MSDDQSPHLKWPMQGIGGVLVVVGIVEIAVASAAKAMTQWGAGAWWAGLCVVICGILGLFSNSRNVVFAGMVFGVCSIVLTIAGAVADGIFYGLTNSLATCYSTETNSFYGNADYAGLAGLCSFTSDYECLCVKATNDVNSEDSKCYEFDLYNSDNCGLILNKLPKLLLVSCLLCVTLIVVSSIFTCFACSSACRKIDAPLVAPPTAVSSANAGTQGTQGSVLSPMV
ncbi:hypothetical protein B484DRAFT_444734 [Ochromonadaceae sp. CCMP2298]|nr:hypothetical protein B484DRAFT_444734 [Ochromonadaceae sp. CCMP2298]|mmetsp:Transcript_24398/g.54813  ORF Transcript_24398/g.54813 Transcript_24398/m.54813 type:complete len:228 (-) Transcript_24398:372-1055(-)|eukprot:CAMPEP_0173218212 /NCGR_PEP_ID=MMETSP1142-20121109/931_1 /TAXON_ID=483371 /ORGANISM="non described non described, Strain CCMP2298" /LENGTH=227 /DNA_ID=CAMNT_0014145889 /DNA_START=29 /DNA_END=712 /DNA_ORIENTATION=+